jgi:hypothetical protein
MNKHPNYDPWQVETSGTFLYDFVALAWELGVELDTSG